MNDKVRAIYLILLTRSYWTSLDQRRVQAARTQLQRLLIEQERHYHEPTD